MKELDYTTVAVKRWVNDQVKKMDDVIFDFFVKSYCDYEAIDIKDVPTDRYEFVCFVADNIHKSNKALCEAEKDLWIYDESDVASYFFHDIYCHSPYNKEGFVKIYDQSLSEVIGILHKGTIQGEEGLEGIIISYDKDGRIIQTKVNGLML